jgi:hypothetical protein
MRLCPSVSTRSRKWQLLRGPNGTASSPQFRRKLWPPSRQPQPRSMHTSSTSHSTGANKEVRPRVTPPFGQAMEGPMHVRQALGPSRPGLNTLTSASISFFSSPPSRGQTVPGNCENRPLLFAKTVRTTTKPWFLVSTGTCLLLRTNERSGRVALRRSVSYPGLMSLLFLEPRAPLIGCPFCPPIEGPFHPPTSLNCPTWGIRTR